MPFGCLSLVPDVALDLSTSKSTLDLGIGMGFYGAVVRQWRDVGKMPWKSRLVGVEAFAGYRNPCWDLYDEVHVMPIHEYLQREQEQFDVILLLDVIEHFRLAEGTELVGLLKQRLRKGGRLWMGTPAIFIKQGAVYGNEFEEHKCLWTKADFEVLGFKMVKDGSVDQWGSAMLLGVYKA